MQVMVLAVVGRSDGPAGGCGTATATATGATSTLRQRKLRTRNQSTNAQRTNVVQVKIFERVPFTKVVFSVLALRRLWNVTCADDVQIVPIMSRNQFVHVFVSHTGRHDETSFADPERCRLFGGI